MNQKILTSVSSIILTCLNQIIYSYEISIRNNSNKHIRKYIIRKRSYTNSFMNISNNKLWALPNSKESIVDQTFNLIVNMTLIEAHELATKLEEKFGLKFQENVTANEIQEEEKVVPKTTYNLVLQPVDMAKRIPVIKEIRTIKSELSLKEAKELVDKLPQNILENATKEECELIGKQLTSLGAKCEIV